MFLVIALNAAAAVVILGGIALAMWALHRGLGDTGARQAAHRQPQLRQVPGTARRYAAAASSGRAA